MGRPWFKHWSNASSGASLRTLLDNKDYEAYSFYWLLVEMLARFEDKNRPGSMTISWAVCSRETGWKPTKCRRVLSRISSVSKIDLEENPDGTVVFLFPKWSELQTSWGGKREARLEQDAGRSRSRSKKRERERERDVSPTAQSTSVDTIPTSGLVKIWNQERGHLPGVKILSKQRERKAKLAWGAHPSEEFWIQVITRIRASPFCTGANDRGWVADFDFLLKPDTPAKVLEGKYDSRNGMGFTQEQVEENRRMRDELDRSFEDPSS